MTRFSHTLRTALISATIAVPTFVLAQPASNPPPSTPPANTPPPSQAPVEQAPDVNQSVVPAATPTPAAQQPRAGATPATPAAAARAELAKARENLATVTRKLQGNTENTAERADAQKAVASAKAAYDDARAKAIASLANNPDYKAAESAATAARQRMNDLAASGQATPESRMAAASAALNSKSALTRLQDQALDADNNVKQTKAAYNQATANAAKFRADQNATFPNNPEWVAANNAVDAARTKLAQAESPAAAANAAQPAAAQIPPTPQQPQQQQQQPSPFQQTQPNVAPTPIHPTPQPYRP